MEPVADSSGRNSKNFTFIEMPLYKDHIDIGILESAASPWVVFRIGIPVDFPGAEHGFESNSSKRTERTDSRICAVPGIS